MKKELLLIGSIGLLSLVGCASSKYETRTSTSNFDGTVSKGSTPALLTCNEWKEECPVLTFVSSTKTENTVGVSTLVRSSLNYYGMTKLAFNIDGKIIEVENVGLTDYKYNSTLRMKESSAMFVMPKSIISDMKNAERIWVKVSTQKHGAFERAMLDNGIQSKAFKALLAYNP